MIKLLVIAFLYISDFSYINSIQFTGKGFCAAAKKGVFVYELGKGIVASIYADNPYLAAYDPASGEIVYVSAQGGLYFYSTFFNTLRYVGKVSEVTGMGLQNGIIMLLFKNGTRRFLTRYAQPAPGIYIDTFKIALKREIPLYLRTRTYRNGCYAFYRATSFARGYNYDYVGTDGAGVFVFDRTMKKELLSVFTNIVPPIYRLIRVFDTIYVLHRGGITKISHADISSIPANCFRNGFYPVDILYGDKEEYVINTHGYYTANEPFFFTPFEPACGNALKVIYPLDGGIIVLQHCLLKITEKGALSKLGVFDRVNIEDAGVIGENIYLIVNGRLVELVDTLYREVVYENEPIQGVRIIESIDRLYVPARRGMFVVKSNRIRRIQSPFNMLEVKDGIWEDGKLYLSLTSRIVELDLVSGTWNYIQLDNAEIKNITTISVSSGRLYIGSDRGLLIK